MVENPDCVSFVQRAIEYNANVFKYGNQTRAPIWRRSRGEDDEEWIVVVCGIKKHPRDQPAYTFRFGDRQLTSIRNIPDFSLSSVRKGVGDTVTRKFYGEGGAVVSVGSTLFLLGGKYWNKDGGEGVVKNCVFKYDMVHGKVTKMKGMKEKRCFHAAFVQDEHIVVFEGLSDAKGLCTEFYDILKDDWLVGPNRASPSLSSRVNSCVGVSAHNRGFVCGGRSTYGCNVRQKSMYELVKDDGGGYSWKERASMNRARADHWLAAIDWKIYAYGGVGQDNYRYIKAGR